MRSNFKIIVEGSSGSSAISLYCNTRQAVNVFNALAFALPENKQGYKKLVLSLEGRGGLFTVMNSATFKGVKNA